MTRTPAIGSRRYTADVKVARYRSAALVAALLCAGRQLPGQESRPVPLAPEVTAALERARPALWKHLEKADGAMLGLLVLAAAQEGLPQTDARFVTALGRLDASNLTDTYGLALRLMAYAELEKPQRLQKRIRDDCKKLLAQQCATGGFSYSIGSGDVWDLSNTQFGALGMRAAAALGCDIPRERWVRLAKLLLLYQDYSGGFGYVRFSKDKPYSSMTVAGIGALEICRQHLTAADAPGDLAKAIAKAWEWQTEHVSDIGNWNAGNTVYFHYGLERAGVLSDLRKLGDVDWHRAGAEMLLAKQRHGGGWVSAMDFPSGELNPAAGIGNPVATAFAVLFLRKRFQKVLITPLTPLREVPLGALDAQASDPTIQATAKVEIARGKAAVPDLLMALRSDIATRRRAALLALTALAGKDFGIDPLATPDQQASELRAAEAWWLEQGSKTGK